MRLALRTLFWLTLACAVAVGWWIEHRQAAVRYDEVKNNRFFMAMPGPSKDSLKRRRRLGELAKASDDELRRLFAAAEPGNWTELYSEYDLCLVEMARRKMTDDLQQAYDALMAERTEQHPGQRQQNTKLLTALRRAQGQPDPLQIHVGWKQRDRDGKRLSMPWIVATVENVDVGRETVDFDEGGDDRSGRRTRWRIHLYDEQGNRVPDANFGGYGGGGLGTIGALTFGDQGSWSNWLDARFYVQPPPTGKYKLQVIHTSDWVDIAGEPDLTGLIVFRSEPIDVLVTGPSRQQTGDALSTLPLLAVLGSAWAGLGLVCWRRRRPRSASADQASPRLVQRRDWLALAVVTLLALGWHWEVGHLQEKIRASQLDSDSDWTLRAADEAI